MFKGFYKHGYEDGPQEVAKNHFRACGKGADLLNGTFKVANTCAIEEHGRARDKIKGRGHFVEVIYDVGKTPYVETTSVRPSVRP